ncbi:MAG: site-2 protease family protein [Methanomassiliicoccales archaeon]|nr:site-2 protease family protein [Methanomassiliicoccales archaeon]
MRDEGLRKMYDEYGNLYVPAGFGKIHFGRQEVMHIGIAVAVLTFAFTVVIPASPLWFAFVISLVAVSTGFLLHELMHKFVAQRYGAWAEFRVFPLGLMLAVVFSLFGFVFAAPGAVYIQGRLTPKQNGLVSIAGPGINLVIGGTTLFASYLFPVGSIAWGVLSIVASVNIFLALFNLLPIPPLDGSKVLYWNKIIYGAALAASIVLLAIAWGFIQF